ncbi:MAG: hypothetical protein P9L99_12675 [Candidatus Lernaella stagnicola]|nr:hypothetical protein [Candidatus Lernaella stagnicola]
MSAVIDLTRQANDDFQLERLYRRQTRLIKKLGIVIPPEQELFLDDAPLEVKVQFFSWLIHEATS